MPKKSTKKPTEKSTPESAAETLRRIYARHRFAERGPLNRVSQRLFALAEAAGIKAARRVRVARRHELYLTACERGFEQSDEAKALRYELSHAGAYILRVDELRRKVSGQEQEACRNISKDDPLSEAERKRVNNLRQQLEALDREDDQIIRCTRRYEIEKEIYDLEHPIDTNDWSAWEE